MKLSKPKLLSSHIGIIGILFIIVSALLIITGTIPETTSYNLWGCYNLFMYFFVILAVISGIYFFFRCKIYLRIYKKICSLLSALKNPTRRKQFLFDTIVVIGLIIISGILESIYSRFIVGTPNSLGTYFNRYRFLFIAATVLVIYTLIRLRKQLLQHMERAFLIIALICGMLMIYCGHTNTSVSWDDHIHYNNTNSLIGLTEYSRTDTEREFYEDVLNEKYLFSEEYFNMKYYKEHQQLYVDIEENGGVTVTPSTYAAFIQRLAYLPAALFLAIGRLIGLPFYLRYMFGKIGILLVYVFSIYFGMKKLKSGKMLMAGIALLPTNLFIATNYSYDYWVTALSLLGLAYFYAEMQLPNQKLSSKSAAIMIGSMFLGYTAKAVYFPLMAILYLMPKNKFNNSKERKRYIWAVTISILYLFLSFVVPAVIGGGPSTDTRGGEDVNAVAQVIYILQNPLTYTKTLLTFLKDYLSVGSTKGYTTFLAYYGQGSKYVAVTVLIILYAFLDRTNNVCYTSKMWHRIFTVFCCFCAVCLVATALYITFTPVGSDTIAGCQPRYILPLVFPIMYILGSSKPTGYYTKNWHYFISLSATSFILLATFWTTCIGRYY